MNAGTCCSYLDNRDGNIPINDYENVVRSCSLDYTQNFGDYSSHTRGTIRWNLAISPTADSDHDGLTDVNQLAAGTNPIDEASR